MTGIQYCQKSGQQITPIVAGRELAMERKAPFGFLNPRSWLDFFWSPEMQAKFVTRTGKIITPIEEGLSKFYQGYRNIFKIR